MEEEVKLTRKEKIFAKIKAKVTNPKDIRYRGPLSYRYLRLIAWVVLALGQLVVFNNVTKGPFFQWDFLGRGGETFISIISSLSAPLFIVASFGVAVSKQKTYKYQLMFYGAVFAAMGIILNVFYYRYLMGIFGGKEGADALARSMNFIYRANVFTDLFMFVLFDFFINFNPKKHFKDKKIIIFRLFAIIPVLYIIGCFAIKVCFNMFDTFAANVPFAIFPFMASKSPLVFIIFASLSLLIKNQEKFYINKVGITKDEYKAYLKTNRNSLAVSITLSILVALGAIIEVALVAIGFGSNSISLSDGYLWINNAFGVIVALMFDEAISLFLSIPIIMLYSYSKTHKEKLFDILLPFAGIAMVGFVYLECIYHLITRA